MNEFLRGILVGINSLFGNYGWSIIVFTLLIRLVLFPFDYKSRVSMRKTTKLQPQMAKLQKKYANDKDKLNAKMAELYKKEGVNPLSSCLPMLLTFPIMIAMFNAMRMVANEGLVQQTFDILSGQQPALEGWLWIKNLWMPDSPFAAAWPDMKSLQMIPSDIWQTVYATLSEAQISALPVTLTADSFANANLQETIKAIYTAMSAMPEYVAHVSTLPGWNFNLIITTVSVMRNYNGWFLLPLMSAGSQYLMTVLQPTQPAGDANQQQAGMNGFMKWFFPLFTLWLCFSYTAAFAVYWVASNLIAIVQNYGINWYLDRKEKNTETIGEGTVK